MLYFADKWEECWQNPLACMHDVLCNNPVLVTEKGTKQTSMFSKTIVIELCATTAFVGFSFYVFSV